MLTLLVHFGYFTYDSEKRTIRIPNYEIQEEFGEMIHEVTHKETMLRLKESEQFLSDIIAHNEDVVAANVQKVYAKESAPLWYNDEQALRAVIKLAGGSDGTDPFPELSVLGGGTGRR